MSDLPMLNDDPVTGAHDAPNLARRDYGNFSSTGAGNKIHPSRWMREDLANRFQLYSTNPGALGMSDEERQKAIASAQQASAAQQQAGISQINDAALAGQGFQQGGFAQGIRGQDIQQQGATAQAAAAATELNRNIMDQEISRLHTDLESERSKKAAKAEKAAAVAEQVIQSAMAAAAAAASKVPTPAGQAAGAALGGASKSLDPSLLLTSQG